MRNDRMNAYIENINEQIEKLQYSSHNKADQLLCMEKLGNFANVLINVTLLAIPILTIFMGVYGQISRAIVNFVGCAIFIPNFALFACFAHFLRGVVVDFCLCAFLMILECFSAICDSNELIHGFLCQKIAKSTTLNSRFLIAFLAISTIIIKPGNVECGEVMNVNDFKHEDNGMYSFEFSGKRYQFTKFNGFPCTNDFNRGFSIFAGCVPFIFSKYGYVFQLTKDDFDSFKSGTLEAEIAIYMYDRVHIFDITIVFQLIDGSLENAIYKFQEITDDDGGNPGIEALIAIQNSNLTKYLLEHSKVAISLPKILGRHPDPLFWVPSEISRHVHDKLFIYNGFHSVDGPDVSELFEHIENLTNNNSQLAANISDLTSRITASIETNSNLSSENDLKDQRINKLDLKIKEKDELLKEAEQSKKIVSVALIAIIVVFLIVILVVSICLCREKCYNDKSSQSTASNQPPVQQQAQNKVENQQNAAPPATQPQNTENNYLADNNAQNADQNVQNAQQPAPRYA